MIVLDKSEKIIDKSSFSGMSSRLCESSRLCVKPFTDNQKLLTFSFYLFTMISQLSSIIFQLTIFLMILPSIIIA
jgi:hypothetical protein